MIEKRVEKFLKNPKKGLFILAMPMLVGMLMQTLYNIVDTIFIGRLGAEAIAALTFSFPIFFIFIAINSGLGAGMGSRISRFMGEKNQKQAENTAMHGIIIAILLSGIIFIAGMIFLKPLLVLFGATGNVLDLAIDYLSIIFLGVFLILPFAIFANIFTSQGDPKTSMKLMITALGINIILDPILIYVLGYGVKGAAMATVIAFGLGFLASIYFIKTKSALQIKLSSFHYSPKILKEIIMVGIPATLMMVTMSVSFMFINKFVSSFGVDYVAAVGISGKLESIVVMPMVALALAMMTLTGMLYGAKEYQLIKKMSLFSMQMIIVISTFVGLILFLFPSLFLRIFTPDPNLLSLGAAYVRVSVFAYPFMGIALISGRIMQGMGQGFPGFVINLIRTLLVSIPIAYVFIFVLGYGYLFIPISMIIGGIVSNLVGILWLKIRLNKIHIEI